MIKHGTNQDMFLQKILDQNLLLVVFTDRQTDRQMFLLSIQSKRYKYLNNQILCMYRLQAASLKALQTFHLTCRNS